MLFYVDTQRRQRNVGRMYVESTHLGYINCGSKVWREIYFYSGKYLYRKKQLLLEVFIKSSPTLQVIKSNSRFLLKDVKAPPQGSKWKMTWKIVSLSCEHGWLNELTDRPEQRSRVGRSFWLCVQVFGGLKFQERRQKCLHVKGYSIFFPYCVIRHFSVYCIY